jgi:outer membrane protein assembly factor BamB
VVVGVAALVAGRAGGQNWSQWRGDNRDGKASEFRAPATWPKQLTKKWEVSIGDGVATPSLVGDRLYVFSRQEGNEIARCLDAAAGEEIWQESYASEGTTGGAGRFQGPRSSPTVVDGKVVTLGVRGILSCLDAATGKVLWRKNDFPGQWPRFFTASSPTVVDGLCIAQLGGDDGNGAIVAYDLATGEEQWRAPDLSPSYASPMCVDVDGTKVIIAATENDLVGVDAADGRQLWKIQFTQGRYNAATPIVDGQTLVLAGPGSGMSAITLTKDGSELAEEQLWTNTDNSVQFSSPVLKGGLVFGLSNNNTLFCINAETHATAWSAPLGGAEPPPPAFGPFGPGPGRQDRPRGDGPPADGRLAQSTPDGQLSPEQGEQRDERRGWRGFGGRGRGGRGRGGYGSIVDAGSVLLALTPASELVVYEPSATEFKELARYKLSDTPTYAYPVASGKRIFAKDQDAVALWVVE